MFCLLELSTKCHKQKKLSNAHRTIFDLFKSHFGNEVHFNEKFNFFEIETPGNLQENDFVKAKVSFQYFQTPNSNKDDIPRIVPKVCPFSENSMNDKS